MRGALLLALAALLPGCTLLKEPGPREVSGATDGYTPTATFLKVLVHTDGGESVWVDFDRRDWRVSELARRLDDREVRYLVVHGQERATLGEVLAIEVRDPAELQDLNYAAIGATARQRALWDVEYDELLKARAPRDGPPPLPAVGAP